jgi:hypothetical protein
MRDEPVAEDRVVTSALPVPIEFELPERWRPAEPDGVGAPSAAYVALRPEPAGDFVANITVSGEQLGTGRTVTAYADEALQRLRETAPDAELTKRTEAGSQTAPGLTQVVSLTTDVNGHPRRVLQVQVFLAVPDPQDAERQAVIELVLSAVPEEIDQVVGDFRTFVDSVSPHAEPSE